MVSWCGHLQEGIWKVRKKMKVSQRRNLKREIILLHRNMQGKYGKLWGKF